MTEEVWVFTKGPREVFTDQMCNWSSCNSPRQRNTRANFEVRSSWLQVKEVGRDYRPSRAGSKY